MGKLLFLMMWPNAKKISASLMLGLTLCSFVSTIKSKTLQNDIQYLRSKQAQPTQQHHSSLYEARKSFQLENFSQEDGAESRRQAPLTGLGQELNQNALREFVANLTIMDMIPNQQLNDKWIPIRFQSHMIGAQQQQRQQHLSSNDESMRASESKSHLNSAPATAPGNTISLPQVAADQLKSGDCSKNRRNVGSAPVMSGSESKLNEFTSSVKSSHINPDNDNDDEDNTEEEQDEQTDSIKTNKTTTNSPAVQHLNDPVSLESSLIAEPSQIAYNDRYYQPNSYGSSANDDQQAGSGGDSSGGVRGRVGGQSTNMNSLNYRPNQRSSSNYEGNVGGNNLQGDESSQADEGDNDNNDSSPQAEAAQSQAAADEEAAARKEQEAAEASEAEAADRSALDEQQQAQREIILAQAQSEAKAIKEQQEALLRQQQLQQQILLRRHESDLGHHDELRNRKKGKPAGSAETSGFQMHPSSKQSRKQQHHHQQASKRQFQQQQVPDSYDSPPNMYDSSMSGRGSYDGAQAKRRNEFYEPSSVSKHHDRRQQQLQQQNLAAYASTNTRRQEPQKRRPVSPQDIQFSDQADQANNRDGTTDGLNDSESSPYAQNGGNPYIQPHNGYSNNNNDPKLAVVNNRTRKMNGMALAAIVDDPQSGEEEMSGDYSMRDTSRTSLPATTSVNGTAFNRSNVNSVNSTTTTTTVAPTANNKLSIINLTNDDLLAAAQHHHYGAHYGSLQGHHGGGGHHGGHYYQFAESKKKGQYDSAFKRGNKKFHISGKASQAHGHADGYVKWAGKKGKGSHHWDLKHKNKGHYGGGGGGGYSGGHNYY